MSILELNEENLRKGWNGANQYWFSHKDYKIYDTSQMSSYDKPDNQSLTAYFIQLGFIPFFTVVDEEVMRAFISNSKNAKLKTVFAKIDSDKYVDTFWKYFNVYPELSDGYKEFETQYVLDKAIKWCKQNEVDYTVE